MNRFIWVKYSEVTSSEWYFRRETHPYLKQIQVYYNSIIHSDSGEQFQGYIR